MRLDHTFTVPASVEQAWEVLLDVPRIAPCMPGATLTEFDGAKFTGTVKVKLGPVTLTYRGSGRFADVDEGARRVVIEAAGKESRGAGTAAATVTALLVPNGESTRVEVGTDLTITGRPAQFGRGMIFDVGERLIGQFADSLAATLGEPATIDAAAATGSAATGSGTTGSGTTGSGTTGSGTPGSQAPPAEPRPTDAAAGAASTTTPDAEPIDLLEVTGVAEKVRKYGVPAAIALASVAIVLLVACRTRHRRHHRRHRHRQQ